MQALNVTVRNNPSEGISDLVRWCPLCCAIPLTKGHVALVDPEVWVAIDRKGWRVKKARGGLYALKITHEKGKAVYRYMHRWIMSCPKGLEVHHINGSGLDNRRANLMIVTPEEHKFIKRGRRRSCL